MERDSTTIRITIEVQFKVKDLGDNVKLMRHSWMIEEKEGRMVLGPTVGWMPVWPIPNCQGYDEKNAPGVQVITDRAWLPISKLRDCEYIVKVSIFVVEGTVVEEELPQDVQWVVLFCKCI